MQILPRHARPPHREGVEGVDRVAKLTLNIKMFRLGWWSASWGGAAATPAGQNASRFKSTPFKFGRTRAG